MTSKPDAHLPDLLTCTACRRKCSKSRAVPGSGSAGVASVARWLPRNDMIPKESYVHL